MLLLLCIGLAFSQFFDVSPKTDNGCDVQTNPHYLLFQCETSSFLTTTEIFYIEGDQLLRNYQNLTEEFNQSILWFSDIKHKAIGISESLLVSIDENDLINYRFLPHNQHTLKYNITCIPTDNGTTFTSSSNNQTNSISPCSEYQYEDIIAIATYNEDYLQMFITFTNPIIVQSNERMERITYPWRDLGIQNHEILKLNSWVNMRRGQFMLNLLTRQKVILFSIEYNKPTKIEAIFNVDDSYDQTMRWSMVEQFVAISKQQSLILRKISDFTHSFDTIYEASFTSQIQFITMHKVKYEFNQISETQVVLMLKQKQSIQFLYLIQQRNPILKWKSVNLTTPFEEMCRQQNIDIQNIINLNVVQKQEKYRNQPLEAISILLVQTRINGTLEFTSIPFVFPGLFEIHDKQFGLTLFEPTKETIPTTYSPECMEISGTLKRYHYDQITTNCTVKEDKLTGAQINTLISREVESIQNQVIAIQEEYDDNFLKNYLDQIHTNFSNPEGDSKVTQEDMKIELQKQFSGYEQPSYQNITMVNLDCQELLKPYQQIIPYRVSTREAECVLETPYTQILYDNFCALTNNCYTCQRNPICKFKEGSCQKYHGYQDQTMFNQIELTINHTLSRAIDPLRDGVWTNISFPLVQQYEPIPIVDATTWYFKKLESCGAPSFCPANPYQKGSDVEFRFNQRAGIVNVSSGEYCSWFFDGELGPEFIVSLRFGDNLLINRSLMIAEITICLFANENMNVPCLPYVLARGIGNSAGGQFTVKKQFFRITLIFDQEAQIDTSQFWLSVISFRRSQRDQAQVLFYYLLWMMIGFFGLILFCLVLRKLLVMIFGMQILRWIDPEPLVRLHNERLLTDLQVNVLLRRHITVGLVKRVNTSHHFAFDQSVCSFCLETFETGGGELIEIFCGHVYHESCWRAWISQQKENLDCPICKRPLTVEERNRSQL